MCEKVFHFDTVTKAESFRAAIKNVEINGFAVFDNDHRNVIIVGKLNYSEQFLANFLAIDCA